MTTNGTHEMVENDTPLAASNVGQRRVSAVCTITITITNFSLYTMPHPFKCSKCHATQLCRIGLGHAPVVTCPCGYVDTVEINHASV